MHAALNQSIVGGMLLDTRFHLFSRRRPSGVIDKPRTVFAISTTLIEASPELDKLLTGGFSESVLSDIFEENTEIEGQEVTDAQYGYESDSDLEDDDVEIELGTADSGNQPAGMSAAPDAVLKKADHDVGEAIDLAMESGNKSSRPPTRNRPRCPGRTVFVKDIAYKTWQALLSYLYTGRVAFAPLRSAVQSSNDRTNTVNLRHPFDPPLCSPKSMYRLADKYGLEELKKLAYDNICSQLTADNVLPEVFSKFTSRFSEIRELEVKLLSEEFLHKDVIANTLPDWIANLADGDLPHAKSIWTSIIFSLIDKVPYYSPLHG